MAVPTRMSVICGVQVSHGPKLLASPWRRHCYNATLLFKAQSQGDFILWRVYSEADQSSQFRFTPGKRIYFKGEPNALSP